MGHYNKTTGAIVAGALTAIFSAFVDTDPEAVAAGQTLLTAFLVWLLPNKRPGRALR